MQTRSLYRFAGLLAASTLFIGCSGDPAQEENTAEPLSGSTVVELTISDAGYFWDAGNSVRGATVLQVYQAFVPNEPAQQFKWTQVAGGWTVCSLTVCLSDNGSQVVMGAKADAWNITSASYVQNARTGNYIEKPSPLANATNLATGKTPFAWTFAAAGATTPTPPPTSAAQIIMPLGDSITEGYAVSATFAQGGYRCPLYSLLTAAGESFTFVGDSAALEPGVVNACPDKNWEGHGGYTIGAIQGFEDADNSVKADQPTIILLLAGTNDVAQGIPGSVTAQMTSLLNDLFAKAPSTWVIMSTIPPMNPHASAAAADVASWALEVPSVNTQLRAVAAKYSRVSMIDFYTAANTNVGEYIGPDGIHPTVAGYGVLADLWYGAIKAR